MHASDSDSTLPSVAELIPGEIPAQALLLTIVFHPDVRRIGEWALLDPARETVVGRSLPLFGRGEPALPLDDRHVSRRALTLGASAGGVCARRDANASRCQLGGRELQESLELSARELRRGVPLLLAHNIVLLLRYSDHPRQQACEEVPGLLGSSAYMQALRRQVSRAAACDLDVLVHGPTGTGKELVASAIHAGSCRRAAPLVSVNMSAIPRELAAATLFGAARGAYTGADKNRQGYFQQAQGGSLFLDEVGDTPEAIQPQLLRALQQREVQPVGGSVQQVDVRVISATDAPLEGDHCSFRAALRHRLGALEILVMPLRKHPEDTGELLLHYLAQAFANLGREQLLPGPDADQVAIANWAGLFHRALRYPWPGNVRELRNAAIQIALASEQCLLLPGHLLAAWSRQDQRQDAGAKSPGRSIHNIDDEEIARALAATGHEVAAAARQLGVSRQALYRRMASSSRFRLAAQVSVEEVEAALAACDGNLVEAARTLGVSRAALRTRLRSNHNRGA